MDQQTDHVAQDQEASAESTAELSAEFKALHLAGVEKIQQLQTSAELCKQTLDANAAKQNELLVKYLRLQKSHENLKARQTNGNVGTVQHPFVVVLIDAHTHKFQGNLLSDRSKGAPLAAKLLQNVVQEHLLRSTPHRSDSRILIQAYGTLKLLSEEATRMGLVDDRPLSLHTFTSGFSSRVDVDFVDVQDQSTIRHKLQKRLHHYLHDPNCVQVFLAATGLAWYTEGLGNNSEFDSRVTLVQASLTSIEDQRFALSAITFPQVLVTNPHDHGVAASGPEEESVAIVNNSLLCQELGASLFKEEYLPTRGPPGLIPINASHERLDFYMRSPNYHEWAAYNARAKNKKPCAFFHLGQQYRNNPCGYDHASVDTAVLYCIQYSMANTPCIKGGQCRKLDCIKGHVCQKNGCCGPAGCKMKKEHHKSDLQVCMFVKPDSHVSTAVQFATPSIDNCLINLMD